MGESLYVLEVLTRVRIDELRAQAARDRVMAGLPARATLAGRVRAAVLDLVRVARAPVTSRPAISEDAS
jgi:hypothetical protein